MYRNLLTKKFFRANPIDEDSTQFFVDTTVLNVEFDDMARRLIEEIIELDASRQKIIDGEKAMITALDEPEAILQLMRKNIDSMSKPALVAKALEYEDVLLPKVAEKLLRSDHDTFIENAIRLLARSDENYADYFFERFSEIRSPYVKSLACLYIGRRGGEEIIPWMMDTFKELDALYPEEDYYQGPLIALYNFKDRFYS